MSGNPRKNVSQYHDYNQNSCQKPAMGIQGLIFSKSLCEDSFNCSCSHMAEKVSKTDYLFISTQLNNRCEKCV